MEEMLGLLFCLGVLVAVAVLIARDRRRTLRACPHCGFRTPARLPACRRCGQPLIEPTALPGVPPPVWVDPTAVTGVHAVAAHRIPGAVGERIAHIRWLLAELGHPSLYQVISPEAHAALNQHYWEELARLDAALASAPDWVPAATPDITGVVAPPIVPTTPPALAEPRPTQPEAAPPSQPIASRPPRPAPWAAWDRAVVLLYLGAFLVVAAGLVFATSNWEALGATTRIGLLAATTLGFIAAGVLLWPMQRVRPAAETFSGIGAFLIPMTAISLVAARTETGPSAAAVMTLAALVICGAYLGFSYRPGGVAYRYGAMLAALVALVMLPAALGMNAIWGAAPVAGLFVFTVDVPRLLTNRARRFARPTVRVLLAAQPLALIAGLLAWADVTMPMTVGPFVFVAAAVAAWRLAMRAATARWLVTSAGCATIATVLLIDVFGGGAVEITPAFALLGALALGLAIFGPNRVHRDPAQVTLLASASLLVIAGPSITWLVEAWSVAAFGWLAAAAVFAVIAWVRQVPWLGAASAGFATFSYLTALALLPWDLAASAYLPLALAPMPAALGVPVAIMIHRLGRPAGQTWARPVLTVAAVEATLVTVMAVLIGLEGFPVRHDAFVLVGVSVIFAPFAWAMGGLVRNRWAVVAGALWAELVVIGGVLGAPDFTAGERAARSGVLGRIDATLGGWLVWDIDHLWPALLILSLGVAALIHLVPSVRGYPARDWRRHAAFAPLVSAGVALVAMLGVTAAFLMDWSPIATLTPYGAADWWWPYLGTFLVASLAVATAAVSRPDWVGTRQGHINLAVASGLSFTMAVGLALRMAYGSAPGDRWSWLIVLVAVGGALIAAAWWLARRVRQRTSGDRRGVEFVEAFARTIAGGSSAIVLVGWLGAAGLTVAYLTDLTAPYRAPFPEDMWWLRFVALFLAIPAVLLGLSRAPSNSSTLDRVRVLVWASVPSLVLAVLLICRMVTTDVAFWTYALAALAVATRAVGGWRGTAARLAFADALAGAGSITFGGALVGNLLLAGAGRVDASPQAGFFLALCLALIGLSVWDRQAWLMAPALASLLLAVPYAGVAAGLEASAIGFIYAVVAWVLLPAGLLSAPNATSDIWRERSSWVIRAALTAAVLPIVFSLARPADLVPGDAAYSRLVLAIASLAGVMGVLALVRRQMTPGYAASALGLIAALMWIAVVDPPNIQAYTVPVALYCLLVGWTQRNRIPRVFDALSAAGVALLVLPPLAQSFGPNGLLWALVAGAEALVVVMIGLVLARRVLVAAGIVGLTLVVLRQMLDVVNAVPTWVTLAAVGAVLLIMGTLTLAARDVFLGRLATARGRWRGLR